MPRKKRPSIALAGLAITLKTLLSLLVYTMPLLGFWLASSLAAYRGGATWLPVVMGLLAFPVAPLAWDAVSELRRKRRGDDRERILTFGDRILLRTFAITFTLIAVLLAARPEVAFVALSTRGDWMLDGRHGGFAEKTRRSLFAAAQGLEWLYLIAHKNPFADLTDDDEKPEPPKPGSSGAATGTGGTRGAEPSPLPAPTAKPGGTPQPLPSGPAPITWPAASTLHPLVISVPADVEQSHERVARYLRDREPNVQHRIKALHDYIADRIAYDAVALADNAIPTQDARSVFDARKGVCAGYANLFKAMAQITGDEVVVVVGDARRDVDEIGGGGHAWNAAKIDGKWFLIDATWDAGYVSGRKFTKRYQTDYLFTPPEVFGIDHIPDQDNWQLRARPLTRGEFMRQPMLRAEFFARGFRLERPDRSQVTVAESLEIAIDNPRGQFITASFSPKGVESDMPDRCEIRQGSRITATCSFPTPGVFSVLLFANAEQFGTFQHIATLEAVKR
jgi:hypothetical protein